LGNANPLTFLTFEEVGMIFVYASNVFYSVMGKNVSASLLLAAGDGGIFGPILDQITGYARDLWGVFVGLIIIAATLGMIVAVLRGAGGMLIGGSKETTVAIISVVGIVLLVVVAFVAIPQLAKMITDLKPAAPF
jgi:hypothetical protein